VGAEAADAAVADEVVGVVEAGSAATFGHGALAQAANIDPSTIPT
jgi:hypothetical protein